MTGRLDDPGLDFFARLALRRVQAGHIHATDNGYLDWAGRPVPYDVAQALRQLHAAGCLTEGTPDQFGRRPLNLTVAGAVRLSERGGRRG